MAQIQKYTAQVGLNAPSIPNTQIRSYEGSALQGLGNAISDFAAVFQQREEKKEDFAAADGYKKLQLQLANEMDMRAEQMPEDGTGFHQDFMSKVYSPERNKFLSGLPPRLRERYETMLGDEGSDTEAWSVKSATRERDQLYNWYDSTLTASKEQLASAIDMDPDAYDTLYEQGKAEIEASGLPTKQREAHLKSWERMAQIAHLNRMVETRPEEVLKDLGADPRLLSPTTQYQALKSALIQQESGGDTKAISPKGAIGIMQVMPGTAREIARELRDEMFDQKWSDEQVTEYLSNAQTNERYGEHYLNKMIRQFARRGGLEAALVGYNGGPARAEKWIKSGFDDSVLPRETRDYYKAIMSRLPGLGRTYNAPAAADGRSNPMNVKFEGVDLKGVNENVVSRAQAAFAALGIEKVRINSGYRSPTKNAAAGGATKSQHMHGNALDIDVSGYSTAERKNIIRALSANGFTGFGIGANIIHADVGRRRAWGYAKSSGGGEVPSWASDVIREHLAGSITEAPGARRTGAAGRYATLSYSDRQQFIAKADKSLTNIFNAQSQATAVQKVEMRRGIQNELASLERTGETTSRVDDSAVSSVLGEADYVKYIEDRETALRTFQAKDGIATMTLDEMEQRFQDYEPEPGSETFGRDSKVQNAIRREIDRVEKLRARKPEEAARAYPEVQAAWEAIDVDKPDPSAVQEYVRLTLERQREFGIKAGSEQPVPRPWAMEIGRALGRIPELAGRNTAEVNASIVAQYDALEKVFGEYTDEVILQALSTYKGMGPNTAKLVTGLMEGIAAGGDPLGRIRQRMSQAQDQDEVEEFSEGGMFSRFRRWWSGDGEEDDMPEEAPGAAPEPTDSVNQEMVLRATRAIQSYGDDLDPAAEEALRGRYGDRVYDMALKNVGGQ